MRDYEFYYTQDGSIGLYSYADNDVYHSKFGAVTEAWEKFIIPSGVIKRINTRQNIKILDVCYGIGYNTKALMSFVINHNEKILIKENFFNIFLKKIKNRNLNKIVNKDKKDMAGGIYITTEILSEIQELIGADNVEIQEI